MASFFYPVNPGAGNASPDGGVYSYWPNVRLESTGQTVNLNDWTGTTATASTIVTNLSWQLANATTYSGAGWVQREPERKVTAEVRIAAQMFADHPDPDALLGEQMDELRRQLEEAVGVTIAREAVWENWCTDESWSTDEVVLRAEWTPRSLTVEAWDAWQTIPKMRRVWDRATGRYTEIDEAEFKRREWKSARNTLVYSNRSRAAGLRKRIAERRAEALLIAHLDEEQAREWRERHEFHVHTADGERTYKIKRGRAGNIYLVRGENPRRPGVKRFCFHEYHPDGGVPVQDNVLAQKLYIEACEEQFLAIANPA